MPIIVFTSQCSFLTTHNLESCCLFSPPFLFSTLELCQNTTVIGFQWAYYQIFFLPHRSRVTTHHSPFIGHCSQDSIPPITP